jgi:hypothetical protein
MDETFGQYRARCSSVCGERIERPTTGQYLVQQRQHPCDERLAQPGKPPDLSLRQLGHSQLNDLTAGAGLTQLP